MKKINKGFTLVELIIVIAVIGVLAAILIPVFSNVVNKANQKSALSDARNAVSTITAEVTDGAGQEMPDSLMFAKKGGKVYAFAYTQNTGLEAFDEEGFTMLTNGANDQENFDNTVEAYVQELVSEGYAAAATTARSNLLMKAYRTINPAETRANYAQLTDDEKLQVMHSMIQNVSFDPDKFVLQFSYTPTQAFFADHEVVAPVAAGTELTVNGVEQPTGTTLQNAINAAPVGSTIRLYDNVTSSESITVGKNLTIDGNGHTIKTTSGRVVIVNTSNVTVNIQNVVLDGDNRNVSYGRGFQINSNLTNVTANLSNVTIKNITHYAVNVVTGDTNLTINIDNCDIEGYAAINIWSDCDLHVTNSILKGRNNSTYNADGWNDFCAICVEGDTTGETTDHAESVKIVVEDSIVEVIQPTGNRQYIVGFNTASTNNSVTLRNCDLKSDYTTVHPGYGESGLCYNLGTDTNTFVYENCTYNNELSSDAVYRMTGFADVHFPE